MRTRIAYFSPMPPERSGISDYSVDLLERLMPLLDIDIFTNVAETTIYHGWQMNPYSAYAAQAQQTSYQLNVYAMGNHPTYHDEIFDMALREPGLVIMHDMSLYDFYFNGFGARRDLLAAEVQFAHGARTRAQWLPNAGHPERVDRIEVNLLRRIAQRSRALIASSVWGRDRLQEIAPDVPVYHIPLGVASGGSSSTTAATSGAGARAGARAGGAAARLALRIPGDAFVAGVFGHIEPVKRIVQVVEGFADVVQTLPTARLVIAGRAPNVGYFDRVQRAVRNAGLERQALLLDSPALSDFEAYMDACNVIVNLRWPTSGESSAITARAIGLGKPFITSDIPQFHEFSERFCWRIPYDERSEHRQLVSALLHAAQHPEALADARRATEDYVRDTAGWSVVAQRYTEVIMQTAAEQTVAQAAAQASALPNHTLKSEARDARHDSTEASENPLRHVTGVNCIGDITAEVGLGTAARQMLETIQTAGIPVSFIEREFPSPSRDASALRLVKGLPTTPVYPTNLLFYNINDMDQLTDADIARLTGGKYMIARWFWELSQLSEEWIARFSRVDEVWVSSTFTQQCMQAVTTKPITVIPATVEVPVSDGVTRAEFHLPDDRFIFIFTFAATSTAARKNPFAVIDAFEQAFGHPTEPGSPMLVIKAHYVDEFPELKQDLLESLARVGGMLISENFTRQQTNDLLSCADCYVSLHRAEGFGLGPAEAMYLGKPVIATNYSGVVDFMTDENSYLVDYQLRQIVSDDHRHHAYGHLVYQVGMTWAEPDVAHAATLMRRVFERPEERAARGARAARDIRAQFSHEAIGRLIRKRLAEIERDKPTPTKDLSSRGQRQSMKALLQHHIDAIDSLEWSRTRDKALPFGRVKGLGTLLRILARVVVQGRINERQQWINIDAHEELRRLIADVTMLKQQVAETEDTQRTLSLFLMRYGPAIGAAVAQAPELGQYSLTALTEDVNGQIQTVFGAPPHAGSHRDGAFATVSPVESHADLRRGVAWYHLAVEPISDDRAAFFSQVLQQLGDDDVFVLLSSADLEAPFNVGPLHVIFDGRAAGQLRATVVRRSRVERGALELGYDLYFSADDPGFISSELRTTGMWEPSETRFVREHAKPGSVFVDIGANVGYFTILAARAIGASGRVIAVEPDPVSMSILKMNVGLLPRPEIVQVVEAAAGETPGWVRLYRSISNHGDHRVFKVAENAGVLGAETPRGIGVSVPMRRMDEILADVPHVDFVKVDTQGFDFAALKSMESILRRDHPIIICEFWPSAMRQAGYDPLAFRDMFLGLGYQLYQLARNQQNVLPITLDEAAIAALPETGDLNIVAMPGPSDPAEVTTHDTADTARVEAVEVVRE